MHFDPARRYLFHFAHPDDDFFIAGTMWLLLHQGAQVHATWFTSGGFLGRLARRERELMRAMEVLGLPEQNAHLCRFPDLGILGNLDQATDMAEQIIRRIRPHTIIATAYEGGHPDHDAVSFATIEGSRRSGLEHRILEFPLYNGTGPRHHWKWRICAFPPGKPETRYNPLTPEAIEQKYRLNRVYSSQWMYMIPARLASPSSWLSQYGEPYRPIPEDRDYTKPPHAGRLNYERWFNRFMRIRFKDFAHAVDHVRKRARPRGVDED